MSRFHPTLAWTSDRTLRVGLGEGVSPAVHARVRRVDAALRAAAIPGAADVTPAFAAVQVEFDLGTLDAPAAERAVRRAVEAALAAPDASDPAPPARTVEIPVCCEGEFAPDLASVATLTGLTERSVVERLAATPYAVYFVGFAPGFAYLAPAEDAPALPPLDVPRHESPRPSVPAGSVGLAGTQAGVYPRATPGGWRIVGRTPLAMFDPARRPASLLAIGDAVRFRPISPAEFHAARAAINAPSPPAPP